MQVCEGIPRGDFSKYEIDRPSALPRTFNEDFYIDKKKVVLLLISDERDMHGNQISTNKLFQEQEKIYKNAFQSFNLCITTLSCIFLRRPRSIIKTVSSSVHNKQIIIHGGYVPAM